MTKELGVAVVGAGYWGPNLIRNFQAGARTRVAAIVDESAERLQRAGAAYPAAKQYTSVSEMLKDGDVDAVAIATPVSTHVPIANACLEADRHVWVEKPLSDKLDDVRRLQERALARNRILFADHTFIYTGAVRKLRELVAEGALGKLLYLDSARVNLGLFQPDIDVILDLAPHDLSILDFVTRARVESVAAVGARHGPRPFASQAYVTCRCEDGFLAHFHFNWLSPVKVRTMMFGGDKKMAVFDDNNPMEKIRVYDKGIDVSHQPSDDDRRKTLISYRSGDMWAPKIDPTEALRVAANHFADCILDGVTPESGGEEAARIAAILEAAEESLRNEGRQTRVRA